ncbi:MAG: hypothetical protein BWX95_01201 [Bacteroidetes bacterium ADurb.Bin141]|nr:MAG: hypothetical protein BWX95_01201 [Bacteroidetes bacterium ADurb.Bin141]
MSKQKKQVLITFDYELFLGNRSGSVDDCLIKPTNQIIDVIEKHGERAIFFVDTTHLLTLEKYAEKYDACSNDLETVSAHIASISKRGHEIFPHLHPHWLDAEYLPQTNEWKLTGTDKYRFFHLNENERELIFTGSVELLNKFIKPHNPEYILDGYRAGGWCIQPFSAFEPYFKKHKIKYDFSVLGKFYLFSNAQFFDFSEAPEKSVYHFQNDIVKENDKGLFTELNISSVFIPKNVQFLNKIFQKFYFKLTGDHSFNRGEGQIAVKIDPSIVKPTTHGYDILNSNWERVAIELMSQIKMPVYKKFIQEQDYMHFISHPKMLTQHNIRMFDNFLSYAGSRYEIETDFRKMV